MSVFRLVLQIIWVVSVVIGFLATIIFEYFRIAGASSGERLLKFLNIPLGYHQILHIVTVCFIVAIITLVLSWKIKR